MRSMPICLAACSTTDRVAQSHNPSPMLLALRLEGSSWPCLSPAADVQTSMPFFTP